MLRRMRMCRRRFILGTAMTLALVGCSSGSGRALPTKLPAAVSSAPSPSPSSAPVLSSQSPRSDPKATEQVARALWRSRGIRSYSVVVERECSCATRPFRIVVRGARAVDVHAVDGSHEAAPAGLLLSVDDMFNLIERHPPPYDVEYDPTYGFPRSTRLANQRDQGTFSVKDLTRL
jgi:hypothetical protein